MAANRAALDRWAIVPRILRDVSERSLEIELFGRRLPAPVLFAPVGAGSLAAPRADVLVGRAAAELGLPYIFSNQASAPMKDVAAEMDRASGVPLVRVRQVGLDQSPFRVSHDPGHPAADGKGDVKTPNVDPLIETADLREANRAYQANLQIVKQARELFSMTLDLMKG